MSGRERIAAQRKAERDAQVIAGCIWGIIKGLALMGTIIGLDFVVAQVNLFVLASYHVQSGLVPSLATIAIIEFAIWVGSGGLARLFE